MRNLVILGGGYGGLRMIQQLIPHHLPADVHITLIDKNPYHCLKTEFYALVAGTVSEQHIRVPFPEHPRLIKKYGTIKEMSLAAKEVHLENGEIISYDDLVIGLGCEDNFHNVPGAKEYTYSVQSIDKVRYAYEKVNNLPPNATVAIIGAGLSGVETASELKESRPDLHILLFDRGNRILPMFPEKLSYYVEEWFISHDIEIVRHSNITKIEEGFLYNHDERIAADAIIWTAGIQPNVLVRELDVAKDTSGRVLLTKIHHLPTDEDVYVLGDCASLGHAPSAQLAEGQGEQIVSILLKKWNNEPLPTELPIIKLKGTLGSLGKKHGFGLVADRPLLGRVPRLLKSGLLWMYKHQRG